VNYVPPFAIFDMSNFVCHQESALPFALTNGQAPLTAEPKS